MVCILQKHQVSIVRALRASNNCPSKSVWSYIWQWWLSDITFPNKELCWKPFSFYHSYRNFLDRRGQNNVLKSLLLFLQSKPLVFNLSLFLLWINRRVSYQNMTEFIYINHFVFPTAVCIASNWKGIPECCWPHRIENLFTIIK